VAGKYLINARIEARKDIVPLTADDVDRPQTLAPGHWGMSRQRNARPAWCGRER
jgi:hypothetical protein